MKQRHSRVNLKNSVGLFCHGQNTPAHLENISATGALVRAHLSVKIGDFMSLRLDAMEMGGEVIRLDHQRRGIPVFGLQFLKTPESLRMFLLHALAKHNATREV